MPRKPLFTTAILMSRRSCWSVASSHCVIWKPPSPAMTHTSASGRAIGAKMARPEAEVWVIAGDGGFQMTQCELATLQQERLDIKIAVVNNGFLGMVRQWQEFFYDKRYASTPMLSPDFVK